MSNNRVYERFGMSNQGEGMKCGVVEWMKRSTLRWYGHMQRMEANRLVKRVSSSSSSTFYGVVHACVGRPCFT